MTHTMDLRQEIDAIAGNYPDRRSAVMPALYLAQDKYGYLCRKALEEVADILDLPPIRVYEVATFYTLFHTEPVGRYHLQLCTNLSCMLRGSEGLLSQMCQELGIEPGQVTADGQFSITTVECLGSCGTAPVLQVNDRYYEDLAPEELSRLLQSLTLSDRGTRTCRKPR